MAGDNSLELVADGSAGREQVRTLALHWPFIKKFPFLYVEKPRRALEWRMYQPQ